MARQPPLAPEPALPLGTFSRPTTLTRNSQDFNEICRRLGLTSARSDVTESLGSQEYLSSVALRKRATRFSVLF